MNRAVLNSGVGRAVPPGAVLVGETDHRPVGAGAGWLSGFVSSMNTRRPTASGSSGNMLLDALGSRDQCVRHRRAVAADMIDRIELLAEQAHPYDANRKLVAHLHKERHALFTFLTHPDVPAPTGLPSRVSDRRS